MPIVTNDAMARIGATVIASRFVNGWTIPVFFLCGWAPVVLSAALGPERFSPVAGLSFALACAAATHLTQPRHRVELARRRTLAAIALGALGQPIIGVLAALVLAVTGPFPGRRIFGPLEFPRLIVIMAVASTLCALLAAAAAAIWALRTRPAVFAAMLAAGVAWPATLFLASPLSDTSMGRFLFPQAFLLVPFGPAMTLAWHVPMATLTGCWMSGRPLR